MENMSKDVVNFLALIAVVIGLFLAWLGFRVSQERGGEKAAIFAIVGIVIVIVTIYAYIFWDQV